MIVDAIVLVVICSLFVSGLWLLWNTTLEAWRDYRKAPR